MAFNKILILIAVVSISISITEAGMEDIEYTKPQRQIIPPDYVDDLFNPSKMVGRWYVLAAAGYRNPRPQPECWTIDLEEQGQSGFLRGVSNFIDKSTENVVSLAFNANFTEKVANYNDFVVDAKFNGKPLSLAARYFPISSYNFVTLEIHDNQDPEYSGLKIIMSREIKLNGHTVGSPENRVDNTNCRQIWIVLKNRESICAQ